MATATETFKNFIDGESVDAAEGRTDAVLNPPRARRSRRPRARPRRTWSAP